MDRSGLTRGTRSCQARSPSLSSLEVIHEKALPQKTIFLSLVTSPTYSIRLADNLRVQIDSGDPGLSFGCLRQFFAIFATALKPLMLWFPKFSELLIKSQS